MNSSLDQNLKKQHLKVIILRSYIVYLRNNYPSLDLNKFCDDCGLPLSYLMDDDNWVSIEFEDIFMTKFKEIIGNKNYDETLYKIGMAGIEKEVVGKSIYFLCKYVLSLESVYEKLPTVTSFFNKIIKLNTTSSSSQLITYTLSIDTEGLSVYEQQLVKKRLKDFLTNTKGYYSAIPTSKGLPEAKVEISELDENYLIKVNYPTELKIYSLIKKLYPFFLATAYVVFAGIHEDTISNALLILTTLYFLDIFLKYKITLNISSQTESLLVKLDTRYKELSNAQTRLKRKLNESQLTNEIVNTLANTNSREEILSKSCEFLVDLLKYDRAIILQADEKQEYLKYGSSCGENVLLKEIFKNLNLEINISSNDPNKISNVFKLGSSILIENVDEHIKTLMDEQSKYVLIKSESKSFICIPIKTTKKRFGVLIADCIHQQKSMNKEDLSLLETVGKQIAIAIEKEEANNRLIISYENEKNLASSYARFVPWESLKNLNYQSVFDVKIGDGIEKSLTMLFSDIRNFSTLSETMSPSDTLKFLNSYFGRLSPIITKNGGYIDKFIGDCIMAVFPTPQGAVQAGIEIQRDLMKYNIENRIGRQLIEAGIGICKGPTVVGPLGFNDRLELTVISDTVNVASRLDGLCKDFTAKILYSGISDADLTTPSSIIKLNHGKVPIKGKDSLVEVIELVDLDVLSSDFDRVKHRATKDYIETFRKNIYKKLKKSKAA